MPDFPDADSYRFDSGMDGGTAGDAGARRDSGWTGGGGMSAAGSGPAAGTGPITGGAGGMGGGPGPFGGALYCDANGTCLYPSGLLCFVDGQCCYTSNIVDGYCCSGTTCQQVPPWVGVPDPGFDAGPPQPWVPPLDEALVGEPGWRESEDPLCFTAGTRSFAQGVWSDSRGVFVSSVVQEPMNPNGCFDCIRDRVDFNDGSGWRELEGVSEAASSPLRQPGLLLVRGFDNGPLVLYGFASQEEAGQPCGLSIFDDGMRACQPVNLVTDVAVVSDTLAYALLEGSMIRYDGTSWGPLPIPMPQTEMQLMWADSEVVMVTGYTPGAIYTLRDGVFTLENTRTLETFLSIFGFAQNDVFAGTWQGGLFHYDGSAWTKLEVPEIECGEPVIYSMWGANGILYFVTQSAFMRWNGTKVEKLAQLDCDKVTFGQLLAFTSLWGNSENDVFIGLTDMTQAAECGPTHLLHYDGEKFHRM